MPTLTDTAFTALEKFYKASHLYISELPDGYSELLECGFIDRPILRDPNTGNTTRADYLAITNEGKTYIENSDAEIAEKKSAKVHEWINTAIALLALIVALFKQ